MFVSLRLLKVGHQVPLLFRKTLYLDIASPPAKELFLVMGFTAHSTRDKSYDFVKCNSDETVLEAPKLCPCGLLLFSFFLTSLCLFLPQNHVTAKFTLELTLEGKN